MYLQEIPAEALNSSLVYSCGLITTKLCLHGDKDEANMAKCQLLDLCGGYSSVHNVFFSFCLMFNIR